MNNKDTEKLIGKIYAKLDYNLELEDRLEISKKLDEYLVELGERYTYYYSKCRSDYDSYSWVKRIGKCMDAVSNYLLFATQCNDDYTYSLEDNFSMLEKHKYKPIANTDRIGDNSTKNSKYTIQQYLERDDVPDYIYDYIKFADATRYIIQQIQKQCVQITEPILNNHVFFFKTIGGNDSSMTYEEYKRLKKVTGYTKNNSIALDKEILSMLIDHYETMKPTNSIKNIWTEIMMEMDSDNGLDIDLLDKENISLLLKGMCFYGDSEVFDIYFKQIDELIDTCNLTQLQRDIYSELQKGTYNASGELVKVTLGAIAEKLNKSRSHVHSSFKSLVNKIYDAYEKVYEDNYYTYIVKGKYKTCTKCGKVFLATRHYYYIDELKEDGLKSYCKNCTDVKYNSTNSD